MSRHLVPRIAVAAFTVVLLVSVAVTVRALVAAPSGPPAAPVRDAALVADRSEVRAATVLREWDRRRAEAWADGDIGHLQELYIADSAAGRRDAEMLQAYLDRGLRVEGLHTQLLEVEVLASSEDGWRLRVTDRVSSGTVVDPDGSRLRLPRDAATERTVSLRLVGGVWRIAAVNGG